MIKNYRSNNRKQHNNNNTKRKKTRARETLCNLSSDLHRSRQLFLLGSRLKIQKNSSGRVSRENSARSRSIGISSFRGGGQPEDRKLIDTFTAISRYRGIVLPCPRTPFLLFFHLSSFPPPPFFPFLFLSIKHVRLSRRRRNAHDSLSPLSRSIARIDPRLYISLNEGRVDWKRIKAGEEDGSFTEQRGEERERCSRILTRTENWFVRHQIAKIAEFYARPAISAGPIASDDFPADSFFPMAFRYPGPRALQPRGMSGP